MFPFVPDAMLHFLVCYFNKATHCVLSRFSRVQIFATLWTVAHEAPLSKGFSRQEYWSGLPFLLQGIFLTQGLNPHLFTSLASAGELFTTSVAKGFLIHNQIQTSHLIAEEIEVQKGYVTCLRQRGSGFTI